MCYQCGLYIASLNDCAKVDSENISSYVVLPSAINYDAIRNLTCVPDNVKEAALKTLAEHKGSSRESIHRQEMFAAVYHACLQRLIEGEAIPIDPRRISEDLGLSIKEFNSVLRSLAEITKEDRSLRLCRTMEAVNFAIHPSVYIGEACQKNGLEKNQTEITELLNKIIEIDVKYNYQRLLARKPKNIALAVIKMYLYSDRSLAMPHSFASFNGISDNVLKTEIEKIKKAIMKAIEKSPDSKALAKYLN
jgi:hypothetical protein